MVRVDSVAEHGMVPAAGATWTSRGTVGRLEVVDLLRGIVMIVMALDHVRDFLSYGSEQDPMSNPHVTPVVFATRWITQSAVPLDGRRQGPRHRLVVELPGNGGCKTKGPD